MTTTISSDKRLLFRTVIPIESDASFLVRIKNTVQDRVSKAIGSLARPSIFASTVSDLASSVFAVSKSESRRESSRLSSFFEARNGEQTEVTLPGV